MSVRLSNRQIIILGILIFVTAFEILIVDMKLISEKNLAKAKLQEQTELYEKTSDELKESNNNLKELYYELCVANKSDSTICNSKEFLQKITNINNE